MEQTLRLIPAYEDSREQMEGALKQRRLPIHTIEDFIHAYNDGFLHPKNPVVVELTKLLVDLFVNVAISKDRLLIRSSEDVACENAIKRLKEWKTVIKLKRLASTLIDEEYGDETRIVFTSDKQGVPQYEFYNVEVGGAVIEPHWSSEKIIMKNSELANNNLIRHLIKEYPGAGTEGVTAECYFDIVDFIDIDDSFILDIEKELVKALVKGVQSA